MSLPSKKLFITCEIRGQIQRVWRHLPGGERNSKATHYGNEPILSTEEGRKVIVNAVQAGSPYMVARFGTSEGNALYEYWKNRLIAGKNNRGGGTAKDVFGRCV